MHTLVDADICHQPGFRCSENARVSSQLGALGLSYERFPAVQGGEASGPDFNCFINPLRSALGKGEIGCLLSHIGVGKRLVASDSNAALVLEDDVHIDSRLATVLSEVRIAEDEACIYKAETMRARVTIARKPVFKHHDVAAYQLHSHHAGSAAYVVSKTAAARLLDLSEHFTRPVDQEIFDFEKDSKVSFPIHQLVPALCIQDTMVRDKKARLGFASNMGFDRLDTRNGWLLPQTSFAARLKCSAKEGLRPLYTGAYSLRLRLEGRRRLQVEYA